MNYKDLKNLVEIEDIVSKFVGVPQKHWYSNDLFMLRQLGIVAGKPPRKETQLLSKYYEIPNSWKPRTLMDLNIWLQKKAIVHAQFSSSLKASKFDPGKQYAISKKGIQDTTVVFSKPLLVQRHKIQCLLQDVVQRIWQSEVSCSSETGLSTLETLHLKNKLIYMRVRCIDL